MNNNAQPTRPLIDQSTAKACSSTISKEIDPENERDNEFYNDAWEQDWSDMKIFSPMGRHTRRWIRKMFSKIPDAISSIADIGCGEGSLLLELEKLYPKASLLGVDYSKSSVDHTATRFKKLGLEEKGKFSVHDITDPTNPFGRIVDVAVSSEVLEHMNEDELAIENMARWCRYLIITVPGGRRDQMAIDMGHVRHYDNDSLTAKCESAGLEVLFCRSWGFPFAYPWYARLRDRAGYSAVTGSYGLKKRIVSTLLYYLFFLNDLFFGGNKVILLAKSNADLHNKAGQ